MTKRVVIVAALAAAVALGATLLARPRSGAPENAPTLDEMARSVGTDVMRLLHRGHVPGRSAEVMLVPKPHNFLIGRWDLTTLGTDTPTMASSHPNPWAYLTRVPLALYGPPWVDEGRRVDDPVDIAYLATTYAELLGVEGLQAEAPALQEISPRRAKPKVILTVVVDGGGWNALREHAQSWPVMRRLMRAGTLYTNATIGSAPAITGALHPAFGTGAYPVQHGLPGNQMRDPQGDNVDTWLQNADPRYLRLPTVSDLWDERNDNDAVVATIAYEGWHLGMMGHGARRAGGDRDIAVLWELDDFRWWINEDYYELPRYLQETDLETLARYEDALDERDGMRDGAWYGHTVDQLRDAKTRPGTPAFVRFTGDVVMDVLRREDVGSDSITDMIWVEMKMPDFAGHLWNVTGPEQGDVIAETDRQIGRFVRWLDDEVGRGNYIVALSADHGQQPLPELSGGWRVNNHELEADIEERFGPVIEKITPVDIYVDRDEMERRDLELLDIARYVATYTLDDNIPEGAPGADRVPPARLDEKLFAGAFPGAYLASLTDEAIDAFGCGDYEEGVLVPRAQCPGAPPE